MDNLTPITREEILMNDEPLTPITREEKILAGEDLNPATRREYFLKKYRHAGGDVMVEGLSVTENGTYTAPEGKAYSPVEVAVPLPENAYLLKEASGSLVSFSDGADLPMPSFICNIDAVQDLHGQDGPWVGGAGKNKLQVTATSQTINGVTLTVNEDGTVKANGTATNAIMLVLNTTAFTLPSGNYKISAGVEGTSGTTYFVCSNYASGQRDYTDDGAFTSNGSTSYRPSIYIVSGVTLSNVVFKPMIRLATETDPTFAPYSNICPISGHTGLDAWVRGKNLAEDGFTWNIDADGIIENTTLYNTSVVPVRKNERYIQTINGTLANIGVIAFYYERPSIGSQSYNKSRSVNLMSPIFTAPINGYAVIRNTATDTNIQIEKGNTATSYEPYNPNSQTIQVSWQTEAGEVFGGYIDLVSGVLTVVGKYKLFDGSENWTITSNVYLELSDMKSGARQDGLCNYFPVRKSGDSGDNLKIQFGANGVGANSLYIINAISSGYDTLEKVQALTTGMQIVYELATPLTYQLTPTQIKSLLGNNNAWCSTGNVDIDYFAKEV